MIECGYHGALEDSVRDLRAALASEREAHEATRREMEHERERTTALRAEVTGLGELYDAEMDFRAEMRRELGADDSEGFDQFLRRVHRELATLRDRYRPRRQSEEPAPEGAVLIWAPHDTNGPAGWCYGTDDDVTPDDTWTHQPPAPSEEE